jgi:predicted transposase/invertase (TIGR01784 family)
MRRFLDPTIIWAFYHLFAKEKNKKILINFLNALFEGHENPIEDLTFLPKHPDPVIAVLRESVVDVLCRDVTGARFIVEMQPYQLNGLLRLACSYANLAYVNQTVEGIPYDDLKPIRFVAILDEALLPHKKDYLWRHEHRHVSTREPDIGDFLFTFLELDKFQKTFEESRTLTEKWVYFLKHAPKTSDEQLVEIARDYPSIEQAYGVLDERNYTQEEQFDYMRHDMQADSIACALAEAEKEGRAEGLAKAVRARALSMHRQGSDKDFIAKAMGLPPKKVESILAEAEVLSHQEVDQILNRTDDLSQLSKAKAKQSIVLCLHRRGVDKSIIAAGTNLSLGTLEKILAEAEAK